MGLTAPALSTSQPSGAESVRRPPITRQFSWTLAGNVGYAAAQACAVILVAKMLTAADLGRFGLGVAIVTPTLMLTNLQLRSLQATAVTDRISLKDILMLRGITIALTMVVIAAFIAIMRYDPGTAFVILGVACAKCIEAFSDALYGHLQRAERMREIAMSMLYRGALSILALWAALLLSHRMVVGVFAMAAAFLFTLLVYDLRVANRARPMMSENAQFSIGMRKLVSIGLPLGITSVLLSLASNVPRYLLEDAAGSQALGYFVALSYPSALFAILIGALGQSATPRMSAHSRTDPKRFRRYVVTMSAIPLVVVAVAVPVALMLGPRLLVALYRVDYGTYFPQFLVLLGSGALWGLASVLGYAATSSGRLSSQAPAAAIILAGTLALSVAVIPKNGIAGAAWVSLVSGAIGVGTYGILFLTRPDSSPQRMAIVGTRMSR